MAINSRWHLQSVIEVAIISIFLGGFFVFSDWLYTLVYGLVTPLGLAPFVGDALFGLWCMGGSLAFMVVRLPGAALISEIVGALLESMFGVHLALSHYLPASFKASEQSWGLRHSNIRSSTLPL